jgi:hypothetical protein
MRSMAACVGLRLRLNPTYVAAEIGCGHVIARYVGLRLRLNPTYVSVVGAL